MTASDLVRQDVGEPRTCLPEDYERGDAAGKERQEGNRAWLAMHAEEDAGKVLEKLQGM